MLNNEPQNYELSIHTKNIRNRLKYTHWSKVDVTTVQVQTRAMITADNKQEPAAR